MALYTKAQLLAEVRGLLNEPTALFWTDTELNDYIDWGARTISGVTLCTYASDTLNAADTGNYAAGVLSCTLGTDFIKIDTVTSTDGTTSKTLQRLDIRQYGHSAQASADTNQIPQWYYVWGNRIFLWPCPKGTTISAGSTIVYGWRVAEQYYTGSVYEIPDRLQGRVIDFVLGCAYAKSGKYSLTKYHMQNFIQSAMMDRRDVFESRGIVDSKDRFDIPDRTQVAGQ